MHIYLVYCSGENGFIHCVNVLRKLERWLSPREATWMLPREHYAGT